MATELVIIDLDSFEDECKQHIEKLEAQPMLCGTVVTQQESRSGMTPQ